MSKELSKLTQKGLVALAKDLKIPKYSKISSSKDRDKLEAKVKEHEGFEDIDLSKYDQYDEEFSADKTKAKKTLKKPLAPRRSIQRSRFGRR